VDRTRENGGKPRTKEGRQGEEVWQDCVDLRDGGEKKEAGYSWLLGGGGGSEGNRQ